MKIRNVLILVLALFVLRDCLQDEYGFGLDDGYEWGYEVGEEAGTMQCSPPFMRT